MTKEVVNVIVDLRVFWRAVSLGKAHRFDCIWTLRSHWLFSRSHSRSASDSQGFALDSDRRFVDVNFLKLGVQPVPC